MQGLVGKAVLVTGASSGVGRAIVIRLAEEGCHTASGYRKDLAGVQRRAMGLKQRMSLEGLKLSSTPLPVWIS